MCIESVQKVRRYQRGNLKDRQCNGHTKKEKKTIIVDNILHRKLRIELYEPSNII